MGDCLNDSAFARFQNGEMERPEESLVRAHLDDCPRCRQRHAALRELHDDEPLPAQEPLATTTFSPGIFSAMGERIGRYKICGLIGEGGFGSVYLAEQAKPLRRRVALKVIKPGMDSREIVARFEAERQALALMEHPNIAAVYDAGTSASGRPYFVMEYVPGVPITEYCDRHKLRVEERLHLFVRLCEALQHAHQKGIIHRDIKPGNVLVAAHGGEHVPKIIDFGVAKAVGQRLTERTLLTERGQLVGTPEYMSPEQIEMGGPDVDTRSDLYSLGVLLYELLTGSLPFEPARIRQAGFYEMLRIVRDVEPPKPSAKVRTRDSTSRHVSTTVANNRRVDARTLARRLRGDLDRITMKCLEKDRGRRYASAGELAFDVRRHLRHEPILAGPPDPVYRLRKFARRHRALVGAAAVTLLLALAALMFASFDAQRSARRTAVQRAKDFLLEVSELDARDGIRLALESPKAEGLAKALADQPDQLAGFAADVARICERFQLHGLAVPWREKLLDIESSRPSAGGRGVSEARFALARALRIAGDSRGAQEQLQRTRDELSGNSDGLGLSLADVMAELAHVLWDRGEFEEADGLFREALDVGRERRLDAERLGSLMLDHAQFLDEWGDPVPARELVREALDLAQVNGLPLLIARAEHRLGSLLWKSRDFRLAEPYLRRALSGFERLRRLDDPTRDDLRLAACAFDLSIVVHESRGFSIRDVRYTVPPAFILWQRAQETVRAFGQDNLAFADGTLALSRLNPTADPTAALELYRARFPEDHPRLAAALAAVGIFLKDQDRERSIEYLERALDLQRKGLLADSPEPAATAYWLAYVLRLENRFAEAETLYLDSLRRTERIHGPDHPRTRRVLTDLGRLYDQWPQPQAAALQERVASAPPRWPFSDVYRDDDGSDEWVANIDFEDDHMEKVIAVRGDPRRASRALLWIRGRPFNWAWRDYSDDESYRIQVNRDPAQEVSFNVGRAFAYVSESLQWVPFEIPVEWLVPGDNSFVVYEGHDPDYVDHRPWEYDNLQVGIDTEHDYDRSWWFGHTSSRCCAEMMKAAMQATKPLRRPSPLFDDHRAIGFRECHGELMIFLELCEP